MNVPPHIAAHQHCIRNHDEVLASESCGCFYCLAVFPTADIKKWIDERDGTTTAACPHCGIDSVIGSSSGYPITPDFLRQMQLHWFKT